MSRKLQSLLLSMTTALSLVPVANAALPQIVSDAANGYLNGCTVKLNVDGWANQLYVNGVFSGNFRNGTEDMKLARALTDYQYSGRCQYRSQYEINLINDPYLIENFINFQYQNCYVKPNVDGWANQIYIGNRFSGNYHNVTEVMKLRSDLVNYIISGTCVYSPIGGGTPHNPYPTYPTNPYPTYPSNPYPQPNPPSSRYCPDPNTHYDEYQGRCVSNTTPRPVPGPRPVPPTPRNVSCSIYNFTSIAQSEQAARTEVLRLCAASSRGYVCRGSDVRCTYTGGLL